MLNKQERKNYEYIIAEGILLHKETGNPLHTFCEATLSKWIFVMSATKRIYAAEVRSNHYKNNIDSTQNQITSFLLLVLQS